MKERTEKSDKAISLSGYRSQLKAIHSWGLQPPADLWVIRQPTLVANGKKKTLYASTFYHFNRFVEVYLAADYMKLSDGYHVAVANGFANQTEVGVGVRLRF